VTVDGSLAVAAYELREGEIIFTHTEVPPEIGGRGVAQQLVKTALEHARSNDLRVVPLCQYVESYIKRNPQYADLVTD
jgi:predicted GNAT family acetyltransferase